MRTIVLILLLIVVCIGQVSAGDKNILGCQVGFLLSPFGFDDPYSGSLGAGLFYERHEIFALLPLFAGLSADIYGYYPLSDAFTSSLMIRGRLSLGYDFRIALDRKTDFLFSPYLGYGHYWRRFAVYGESWTATRPLVSTGVTVAVVTRSILISIELGMVFLIEKDLLVTMDMYQRLGWRF